MKGYDDKAIGMFDSKEVRPNTSDSNENNMPELKSFSNGDNTEDYLNKLLQIQRSFENITEHNEKIQINQKNLLKKMEDYKDMKVNLSASSVELLMKLPQIISQNATFQINESAKAITDKMTSHADLTIAGVSDICNKKIILAKKEMETGKGVYLSWWNFWLLILLTLISTSYTVCITLNQCLQNGVFKIIWLPLLILGTLSSLIGLIVWLNLRENTCFKA